MALFQFPALAQASITSRYMASPVAGNKQGGRGMGRPASDPRHARSGPPTKGVPFSRQRSSPSRR